jgi:hypothetical protein
MTWQAQQTCCTNTFFHPDYTVGVGLTALLPITALLPSRLAAFRLAGLSQACDLPPIGNW